MTPRRLALRLAPLACAVWLCACGQKGPLYLPDAGASPVRSAPQAAAESKTATPDRSNEPRKQIH